MMWGEFPGSMEVPRCMNHVKSLSGKSMTSQRNPNRLNILNLNWAWRHDIVFFLGIIYLVSLVIDVIHCDVYIYIFIHIIISNKQNVEFIVVAVAELGHARYNLDRGVG